MSGWESFEAQSNDGKIRHVPVIILTVYDHEAPRLKGVLGVFRKSADLSALFKLLATHFDGVPRT